LIEERQTCRFAIDASPMMLKMEGFSQHKRRDIR